MIFVNKTNYQNIAHAPEQPSYLLKTTETNQIQQFQQHMLFAAPAPSSQPSPPNTKAYSLLQETTWVGAMNIIQKNLPTHFSLKRMEKKIFLQATMDQKSLESLGSTIKNIFGKEIEDWDVQTYQLIITVEATQEAKKLEIFLQQALPPSPVKTLPSTSSLGIENDLFQLDLTVNVFGNTPSTVTIPSSTSSQQHTQPHLYPPFWNPFESDTIDPFVDDHLPTSDAKKNEAWNPFKF